MDVTVEQIQEALLRQYNIRVAVPMAKYLFKQLQSPGGSVKAVQVPVIGGDARTGVPVRAMIDTNRLAMEGLQS